jgi:hypothetical protein
VTSVFPAGDDIRTVVAAIDCPTHWHRTSAVEPHAAADKESAIGVMRPAHDPVAVAVASDLAKSRQRTRFRKSLGLSHDTVSSVGNVLQANEALIGAYERDMKFGRES